MNTIYLKIRDSLYSITLLKLLAPLLVIIQVSILNAQKRIPYELKQFTIADGLPDNTVYGCLQDSEGYMWFFTPSGASRFNGRTFENYTINEGLADNEVLNGYEDSQKRIWFYSFNGKLAYFNLRTNRVEDSGSQTFLNKFENKSVIKSIVEDNKQNVWVSYENGIIAIVQRNDIAKNSEIKQIYAANNKYKDGGCGIVYKNLNNINILSFNLWLKFDSSNFKIIEQKKGIFNKNIAVVKGKSVFYSSINGDIEEWNGDNKKIVIKSDNLNKKTIRSLSLCQDELWIGVDNGVFVYSLKEQRRTTFFYTNSLVSRVFCDREGSYWITTLGKGVLLMPKHFQNIVIKNKLYGGYENEITCLNYNEDNKSLVCCSFPNSIYTIDNNQNVFLTKILHSSFNKISKLKSFNNNILFITNNNNFHTYINFFKKTPKQAVLNDGIRELIAHLKAKNFSPFIYDINIVKSILVGCSKTIYIGNYNILKLDMNASPHKKIRYYKIEYDYNKTTTWGRIYSIIEDKKKHVWFGGSLGIGSGNPDTDTVFFYNRNLEFKSTINDMCSLENDVIVVSTTGSGLYLIKDNQIVRHIRELDGLPSNNCNRLFKQDENRVWLATNKGACLIQFQDSTYLKYDITIYGGKNTHPATYINDLLVVHDTLYLATNDGLYSFGINALTPQYQRPILKMLAPSSFVMNPSQKMNLPYGFFDSENQINFVFDGIAFLNGDIMTYQYRLFRNNTLIQSDTISLKDKLSLPFSSLTSGNYRLEVSCKRSDGVESEMSVSEFRVYSPIWRSLYATLVYIIIGGWIVFRILINTTRRNRERERAMIEQQSERNKLERLALEARQQLLSLEQESLRARIDPHFIFNCLNGLMSFVYEKDYDSIKSMLPKLAKLIRSSLQLARRDFIGVEEEVVYLEDYLLLEKMRFEDRFDYRVIIGGGIDRDKDIVPPLMLQIFVENSIKHGFRLLPKGIKGEIVISFFDEGDRIVCEVMDNGVGINDSLSRKSEGSAHISLGIETVRKRIEVLNEIHGIHYAISFMDRQDIEGGDCSGTIVRLSIPVEDIKRNNRV